jgi:D-3-phosphoglycerate dehydrogenase
MKVAFLSKTEISIRYLTEGLAPFPVTACRGRDELLRAIPDADVVVVQNQGFHQRTFDAQCFEAARRLRLVQHHGVACDVTDVEAATRRNVPVATVPGLNGRSVAEHAFFLLLALARSARPAQRLVAEGRMGELECVELAGKTLCVVGLGAIGKMLAIMGRGFSMRVIGVRRNPGAEDARRAGVDAVYGAGQLRDALAQADFTVLALPLGPETVGLIGGGEFEAMKRGAMLVNVSRGPHVDRGALEAALARGDVGGYASDVFWSEPPDPADPLLRDERVYFTPHMGGKSIESIRRCVTAVRENIERIARGEAPVNVVNPSVLRRAG